MSILDEVHSVRIPGFGKSEQWVLPATWPLLTRKQDYCNSKCSRSWWTEEGWQPLSSHCQPLQLADDDDTVDSSSLLDEADPAAINDDDVSSPVVSCCSPNAMDLRLLHSQISNVLRDVDRFGTCTKDSQPRIARDSRRGRRVPLRCTRADCSWEASSSVSPVSLLHSRISNVLKDTRPWNNFSGQ